MFFILPGCDILQIVLELKYTERNMPKTNEIFACFVFFTRIISEDFPLQEKQKPKREEKKVEIFWSTNDGHLGHGFSLFYSNAKLLENHNRS